VDTESSDAELLRGVRDSDPDAWSVLVRRYGSRLKAVARAQGVDEAAAQDAAQTAWLRLLDDPHQIRDPDALHSWLATVVRREAINVAKRTKRSAFGPVPDGAQPGPDPEEEAVLEEGKAVLRRVFSSLDQKCRELLAALYGESEPSYKDVTALLGRPIGSLGPQRGRCLDKLRILYNRAMVAGAAAGRVTGEVLGR
jgi:RNA polymerase sigma factor (sigma-70 family)